MKRIVFLLVCCLTAFMFIACDGEKLQNLQLQIDELKSNQIASIDTQITSIKASIVNLETMDTQLQGYITALQEQQTALASEDAKLAQAIETAKQELRDEITTTNAGLLAELESYKATVTAQLNSLNAAIATLQEKDTDLQQQITDLKAYTDGKIQETKDWASATFVTLEKYNETALLVASIQGQISSINTQMENFQTQLTTAMAQIESLRHDLQQSITDNNAALTQAAEAITAAYTTAIATAITNSENSIKSWVNTQLSGYYTAVQTDAKLATLQAEHEQKLSQQKLYVENLIVNLQAVLESKINANKTLIDNLQGQIENLSADAQELAKGILTNADSIANSAVRIKENAQTIAQNSSDINTCEPLIADNKTLIQANTRAVAANDTAVTALQAKVTASEQGIFDNVANIAKNAADIAVNANLISANATAISNTTTAISDNAAAIAQLRADLQATIADLTESYQAAIQTAITDLDGKLTGEIADNVAAVNTRITQEVEAINTAITTLESRVTACENEIASIQAMIADLQSAIATLQNQVSDLLSRIQSINYVPTYSDGVAVMTYSMQDTVVPGYAELDFRIQPKELASQLAEVWRQALTVDMHYAETRSAPDIKQLTIINAFVEDGYLTILISGKGMRDEFYAGEQVAFITLVVSDGNNELATNYIQLRPEKKNEVPPYAVDMGLSVKWASCNIGASLPEEYGDYYAWGETTTKSTYDLSSYTLCNGSYSTMTKYCIDSSNGTVDNKWILDSQDDVAHVRFDGNWQIPTDAEWTELRDTSNCSWAWTTQNDVNGYLITSKITGNSIFLPTAGRKSYGTVRDTSAWGYYWSSFLSEGIFSEHSDDNNAMIVWFGSADVFREPYPRYVGLSVRPVMRTTLTDPAVTVNGIGYASLEEAFAVACTINEPVVITLLRDVIPFGPCNFYNPNNTNSNILDLNGHNITITSSGMINVKDCKLTLTDSSSDAPTKWGIISAVSENLMNSYVVGVSGTGSFNMLRGSIYSSASTGLCLTAGGMATLTGGIIETTTGTAIVVRSGSTLYVADDVRIIGSGGVVVSLNNSTATLTGGKIESTSVLPAVDVQYSDLSVTGDAQIISYGNVVQVSDGTASFSGGYISNDRTSAPIYASAGGVIFFTDGYVKTPNINTISFTDTGIAYVSGGYHSMAVRDALAKNENGDQYYNDLNTNEATKKDYPYHIVPASSNPLVATVISGTNTWNHTNIMSAGIQADFRSKKKEDAILKLQSDITATAPISFTDSHEYMLTVDLNGYKLSSNATPAISALCPMILQDTGGAGEIATTGTIAVRSSADLTINGGSYVGAVTAVAISDTCDLVVKNGHFYGDAADFALDGEATITIIGGHFKNAPNNKWLGEGYVESPDGVIFNGRSYSYNVRYNGAVDMGLSVKWASCNIGASKPEDYGDYYAWGETTTKSTYNWSTYTLCGGSSSTMTKYCTSSSYGTVDNKTVLDPEDDVAHVKLGGKWRMPTEAEWTELINTDNCTWTWTTLNGVNGRLVTSKKTGNSIFLPAAGFRRSGTLDNEGSSGRYWSSVLYTDGPPYNAGYLYFNLDNVGRNYSFRYYGSSVRPVCD